MPREATAAEHAEQGRCCSLPDDLFSERLVRHRLRGSQLEGSPGSGVGSGAQRPDIAALPVSDEGSRSIAHSGGEDPAWMTPTTLNP
jgi:hypothetical protein